MLRLLSLILPVFLFYSEIMAILVDDVVIRQMFVVNWGWSVV